MTDARTSTSSTIPTPVSSWTRFWNSGGFWKAVAFVATYLVFYIAVSLTIVQLWGGLIDGQDLFGDALSVFLAVGLPVVVGAAILLAFALSVGWLPRPLFARQPVRGSWWMWLAPGLVIVTILLRVFGIDWGRYGTAVILTTFLTGLFIGISEEVLTRGVVVTLLRRRGHGEWVVAFVSSAVFGLLHLTNLIGGQSILVVLSTVVFAFGFGLMMYLTLRVTGNLIWPIILHALTDPTTFLATGGIDVEGTNTSPFLTIAGLSTIVFLVFALVALIFIRGNANGRASADDLVAPRRIPV